MTDFMKAMADEVVAQGGEGYYYSVVTLEPPHAGDTLYHMEKTDFRPGNPAHDCYSVAKSVAATAAGLLYDRGLLRMQDTLDKFLSAYLTEETDRRWGGVTVDQLMRHRTGAAFGTDFDLTNAHLWEDPEWLHTLFAAPITQTPGREFVYSDGNYYILGRIAEQLLGTDLETLLQREVFVPLGFHVNAWSRDVNGHTVGGTGLYLRTEDMAKIGWLYLSRGLWGDRRIYSEEWSDIFLHAPVDRIRYGYALTEATPDLYLTGGMNNQGMCFDLRTRRVAAWHAYDAEGKFPGLAPAFMRYCR